MDFLQFSPVPDREDSIWGVGEGSDGVQVLGFAIAVSVGFMMSPRSADGSARNNDEA
jgi:hypothetical protein